MFAFVTINIIIHDGTHVRDLPLLQESLSTPRISKWSQEDNEYPLSHLCHIISIVSWPRRCCSKTSFLQLTRQSQWMSRLLSVAVSLSWRLRKVERILGNVIHLNIHLEGDVALCYRFPVILDLAAMWCIDYVHAMEGAIVSRPGRWGTNTTSVTLWGGTFALRYSFNFKMYA